MVRFLSCHLQVIHAHSRERINPTYVSPNGNRTQSFISISMIHWNSTQLRLDQPDLLTADGPCTSPLRRKARAQCYHPPASSELLEFILCFASIRSVRYVPSCLVRQHHDIIWYLKYMIYMKYSIHDICNITYNIWIIKSIYIYW